MQVFNVGPLEILFILILAFIVLGPLKAIKTARDIGTLIRNLVRSPIWRDIVHTSNEIRDFPKKIMDDAELSNLMEELDLSAEEINQILSATRSEAQITPLESGLKVDLERPSGPSQSRSPSEDYINTTQDE
jgi:Sec-independent protein translocase protein TatA